MRAPPYFIARHLAHPQGVLGSLVARLMNRHNARMNRLAVECLDAQADQRILEVGFGGGVTLPALLSRAGFVAGVDRSVRMVERANRQFAPDIAARRAQFQVADAEALPFDEAMFHGACTVNTIYFWQSLQRGFAELHRTLAPGGRLVTGFLPKARMDELGFPVDFFTSRAPEEVMETLRAVGFHRVGLVRPNRPAEWCVISAERPSKGL
ncbi:class I SAM-dependent methyltransferase [Bradyrhizobium genosp. P]|uniref:class I SAM-dependent methyltransferase n=1 Tax=Bradyrhizobium genosp. P TaxID=83641 RepID=UPI003CFB188C